METALKNIRYTNILFLKFVLIYLHHILLKQWYAHWIARSKVRIPERTNDFSNSFYLLLTLAKIIVIRIRTFVSLSHGCKKLHQGVLNLDTRQLYLNYTIRGRQFCLCSAFSLRSLPAQLNCTRKTVSVP